MPKVPMTYIQILRIKFLKRRLKGNEDKFNNILKQFKREFLQFSKNFERNKDNPLISKAKSLVACRFAWPDFYMLK